MQLDCRHCQKLLWSFVAKELSDSETKKIEEHLQGCPSCRQEAEQLSRVVSSLREEIPLPAAFSAELHEKLSLAAEEMAAEKTSLKESFLEKLKQLSRHRGFRTLAPALVCLVLVIGVFSSGVYDQWRNSDQMLTEPPISSSVPAKTSTPAPSVTTPATTSQPVTSATPTTEAPAPERTETTPVPAADTAVPTTEAPATPIVEPESGNAESVPAPASVGQEENPVGFAIPRSLPKVSCLMVSDTETFLNGWQESTGYDWKSYLQDVAADEILSGVDPTAVVLELTPDATDSLMDYAATSEDIQENQGETLVVITGDEE